MITNDVETAFNTVRESEIIRAFQEAEISRYLLKIIYSYLNARKLTVTKKSSKYMFCPGANIMKCFLQRYL